MHSSLPSESKIRRNNIQYINASIDVWIWNSLGSSITKPKTFNVLQNVVTIVYRG